MSESSSSSTILLAGDRARLSVVTSSRPWECGSRRGEHALALDLDTQARQCRPAACFLVAEVGSRYRNAWRS